MSEKEAAPKEAKAPAKEKGEVVKSKAAVQRQEKPEWTIERCKQYARRFANESLWASGAPASYKSAVAHGWRDECLAEMERAQKAGGRVISGNFKKADKPAPGKKAA